jgi:hypothetical protein
VDISEDPTDARPSSQRRRGKSSRTRRREAAPEPEGLNTRILVIIGAAVVGPLVLAVLCVGVWLVWRPTTPPTRPQPQPFAAPQGPQPPGNFGAAANAGVPITNERGAFRAKGGRYDAVIESDGCVSSLRVGGTELLHFSQGNVRGCYFARPDGTRVKLGPVQNQGGALGASSAEASIRFEFGADSLTWMVHNETNQPLEFLMVFDPDVKVVGNDAGDYARTPATRPWPKAVFYAGQSRLAVEGGDGLPDPVEHKYQAYVARLGPKRTTRLFLNVGDALPADLAQVRQLLSEHRVQKSGYDAAVAGDGCLTSLRLGGTEVLWVGPKTSRGAFFRQGDRAMRLENIEESGESVTAKNERASVRYDFGPDSVTLTLGNSTEGPLTFQMVFGPAVTAVGDGSGTVVKVPVNREWKTAAFYAGRSKLTLTDGTRLWGPWGEGSNQGGQVWEANLAPRETRRVVLKVAPVSDAEAARLPR